MYSNCKQHWRLRKCVSRNLDTLAHCMGCWHTGMSHSILEDLGGHEYPNFQGDQEGQEDLLNLWNLVVLFWILLGDLGVQVVLGDLMIHFPSHLSLLANLFHQGDPAFLGTLGSLVYPQALVLLWLQSCLEAPEALVVPAGCDWSDNHLESDSASD